MTLMTIHNAKGLEFRAVFVVGVEEEIFPSARSIEEQGVEEERRLFYVGLTRAEEKLTLTHASSRLLWGRTTSTCPRAFSTSCPTATSSASGCARPRGGATARPRRRATSRRAPISRRSRRATASATAPSARA